MNFKRIFFCGFFLILSFSPVFAEKGIRLGMQLEPPHLDPTIGSAGAVDEIVYANVFEGLTRIDKNSEVLPALAVSWKVDKTLKTYRFILRKNVRFHDGTDFNAQAAKFSLDRTFAEDSANAQKLRFKNILKTKVIDDFSLEIILKKPDVDFLYFLGFGDAVIVAEKSAKENRYRPIGTGPFRFDSWKKGNRVKLVKNEDYWGTPARLASAEFYFISDPNAAKNALLSGALDAFPGFPAPEILPLLEKKPKFRIVVGNTEGETILAMNHKNSALKNLKVRRAISFALNRKEIIDGAMYGYATPIGSHFSPNAPSYRDLTGRYPYNPEKAKQLLKESGYENGLKLTIKLPPPSYARRSGEIIAAELKRVGIETELIPVEWARWLDEVFKNKNYDLTIVSHTEPMDLDIYARPGYYFNYENPTYRKIIDRLQTEADPKKRKKLLIEAQQILADDAVNGFLFQLPKITVLDRRIKNLWKNSPIQSNDLTKVYFEDKK